MVTTLLLLYKVLLKLLLFHKQTVLGDDGNIDSCDSEDYEDGAKMLAELKEKKEISGLDYFREMQSLKRKKKCSDHKRSMDGDKQAHGHMS